MYALRYRIACLVCMGLSALVFAVTGFWDLLWVTLACLVVSLVFAGRFDRA
nr:MAG TPA: hypothetical protein [Caudoviricetes sp.]